VVELCQGSVYVYCSHHYMQTGLVSVVFNNLMRCLIVFALELEFSYDYLQKFGKAREPTGKPRLPLGARIRYAFDAAKGMIFLHSRKVIHCDLKTSNLLVANDAAMTVKICDFSMSRISTVKVGNQQSGGGMVVPTHPEATGSGTPGFISPVSVPHSCSGGVLLACNYW
jgi:serine/threonine protein kinase